MFLHRGRLLFSPSDLNNFLECEHLTALDVARWRGDETLARVAEAAAAGSETELLRELGLKHEGAWLAQLRDQGLSIVALEKPEDEEAYAEQAQKTVAAMRDGVDVIYQGVFVDDERSDGTSWRGIADFLRRVPTPSALGDWSYEAYDTKLGRQAKPTYALQLAFYTEQLTRIQGVQPSQMHVILGDGKSVGLKVDEYMAYFRAAVRRFIAFTAAPDASAAYPVSHCEVCRYERNCDASWRAADHLSLVAGIRRETAFRLEKAGVKTMAALGARADRPDTRIGESTFAALREQASLQRSFQDTGSHTFKLIDPNVERGFALLPEPSPSDLFFDMEGYPYFEPANGLEYLFGVAWADTSGPEFRAWWGRDREEEKRAFEGFIDFVRERLREDPQLHVYHYASYERTKLGHLAQQHATREEELDDLLRRQVFVDLYKVTRQSLRTSHEGYSLKDVRQFFWKADDQSVSTAGDSIVAFHEWQQSKSQATLDAIEKYNKDDCVSTMELRNWLIDRKREAEAQFGGEIPWCPPPAKAKEPVAPPNDESAELRNALVNVPATEPEAAARRLLASLLDYHRREDKPEWWEYFARFDASTEELLDDAKAIVGLEPDGDPIAPAKGKRSWAYPLKHPDQEHGFDAGDTPDDFHTRKPAGSISALNYDTRSLSLTFASTPGTKPLPAVVVAGKPIEKTKQREAVRRVAEAVRDSGFDASGPYAAIHDILLRRPPRLRNRLSGLPIQTTDLKAQRTLIADLDRSALVIQGPPGSGKTWTAARLITPLIAAGARVGVAAYSHRAVHNVLAEVERVARDEGVTFLGVKKSSGGRQDSEFEGTFIRSVDTWQDAVGSGAALLAGTTFFFPYLEANTLDYLFIDEAGQMSLGDAVACAAAARNVILIGDPQQLPHVSHGIHPDEAGVSVLEHSLAGAATVSPDQGLFLDRTFRMHPDVCRFVSRLSYDNRLEADPSCATQRVDSPGLSGTGLRFLPVNHRGNARLSIDEADVVAREVKLLLDGGTITDRHGETRPLTPADILVVSPYNMQRRCLRERVPAGVEVGTVDKFQGREAGVVIFSMATSSGDDAPRGLDFLFSRNRLNVAVSRARCLSVLVASPRLLDVRCHTLEQMAQVNGLCQFVEAAGGSAVTNPILAMK